VEHLRGATTLYNTYWVRFPHGDVTFERAVANSQTLIGAARDAGVRRIVHVSITNPSEDSPFGYFRGKARVEEMIRDSGLGYKIVRATVIFGREDILINNIAYILRRLPVFGIPGSGSYRLRPVSVEDVADICVRSGARPAFPSYISSRPQRSMLRASSVCVELTARSAPGTLRRPRPAPCRSGRSSPLNPRLTSLAVIHPSTDTRRAGKGRSASDPLLSLVVSA
jgi:nucleoside-diphosphate-sugar epimerase